MGLTILRKKVYYALGFALAVLGVIMSLTVVWRWWATDVFSDANVSKALMASFGNADERLGLGVGISLFHKQS